MHIDQAIRLTGDFFSAISPVAGSVSFTIAPPMPGVRSQGSGRERENYRGRPHNRSKPSPTISSEATPQLLRDAGDDSVEPHSMGCVLSVIALRHLGDHIETGARSTNSDLGTRAVVEHFSSARHATGQAWKIVITPIHPREGDRGSRARPKR